MNGLLLSWFELFLNEKLKKTEKLKSELFLVSCEVGQEHHLGPLLFSIFIK